MKTKEEIIANATNDHDRELMRKSLDEFDKIHNQSTTLMWIASFFTVVGMLGMGFNPYFVLSFIPVFPLIAIVMFRNLKSVGLY